jgi:hypothetical protein
MYVDAHDRMLILFSIFITRARMPTKHPRHRETPETLARRDGVGTGHDLHRDWFRRLVTGSADWCAKIAAPPTRARALA